MNAPLLLDGHALHAGLPCALVRGGTSKGVFLLEEHLPTDPEARDRLLLDLMGSPDPRQINGLGGADPLTSKVAIIARSSRENIDIEYESIEVGIGEARVNHGLMCGNLLAGVGYFAMAEGLIQPQAPLTTVRIYCRSNQKTVVAKVPALSLASASSADDSGLDPDTVELFFTNPQGAITGQLLPAKRAVSRLKLDNGSRYEASIVDAGTLYAFIRAEAFGLNALESPTELDGLPEFRASIEALRQQVARHINHHRAAGARAITPRQVKMAIFAPAAGLHGADLAAIIINPAKVHKAFAVSGAIALAAAAAVQDSLVQQLYHPHGSPFELRIRHPSGVISLRTHWSSGIHGTVIHAAEIRRSARIILRGTVFLPPGTGLADPAPEHIAKPTLETCVS